MNIAHICTPHGFGHITRQIALAYSLQKYCVQSTFFCHQPSLVHETLPNVQVFKRYADVGIIQKDAYTIDIKQTQKKLEQRCSPKALEEWVSTLRNYDLVIADIPPLIFAAAQKAKIPALGIGNFDWIWIYEHFPQLKSWAEKMRDWQKGHLAIQLSPGAPLNFTITHSAYWLARERNQAAPSLPQTSILVGFGGLHIEELQQLPVIPDVYWVITTHVPNLIRNDILSVTDIPFSDLSHAVDIIFSKAGYGILSESQCAGTPQIWMHRSLFPEAPILERFASSYGDIIIDSLWGTKQWRFQMQEAIEQIRGLKREPQKSDNDSIARWIYETYSSFGS